MGRQTLWGSLTIYVQHWSHAHRQQSNVSSKWCIMCGPGGERAANTVHGTLLDLNQPNWRAQIGPNLQQLWCEEFTARLRCTTVLGGLYGAVLNGIPLWIRCWGSFSRYCVSTILKVECANIVFWLQTCLCVELGIEGFYTILCINKIDSLKKHYKTTIFYTMWVISDSNCRGPLLMVQDCETKREQCFIYCMIGGGGQ